MTRASAARATQRSPHVAPALTISEADLQSRVIDLALYCGWRVCHVRPVAAVERGGKIRHLTPYEGHPGLPDLILARGGVVLLVELKSQQGRASVDQRLWLAAAGPQGRLWRSSDWPEIRETLRRAA
jgi:hypothetical protein